jgi:cytochrome c556
LNAATSSVLALAAALFSGSVAQAQQTVKSEDVIKFRKGIYQVIGWHLRPLGQMVKGQMPYDKELFAKNSAILEQMSRLLPDSYLPGSDEGDTRARPEIWTQPEKFRQAMENFQAEASGMREVAQTGDFAQVRTQFGALSKTCSSCHNAFRTK